MLKDVTVFPGHIPIKPRGHGEIICILLEEG